MHKLISVAIRASISKPEPLKPCEDAQGPIESAVGGANLRHLLVLVGDVVVLHGIDHAHGDTESWVNHEIVEKSKAFSAGGGIMPAENPTYAGYVFYGWTKNNSDTAPDFDENTVIVHDMKVYSVWRKPKIKFRCT